MVVGLAALVVTVGWLLLRDGGETGLTTGAATRLVERLERDGHVRWFADTTDRRRVIVEPVASPVLSVDDAVGPARRLIADVLARCSPEQLDVLFDYFTHATLAIRQAVDEIGAARPTPPDLIRGPAPPSGPGHVNPRTTRRRWSRRLRGRRRLGPPTEVNGHARPSAPYRRWVTRRWCCCVERGRWQS